MGFSVFCLVEVATTPPLSLPTLVCALPCPHTSVFLLCPFRWRENNKQRMRNRDRLVKDCTCKNERNPYKVSENIHPPPLSLSLPLSKQKCNNQPTTALYFLGGCCRPLSFAVPPLLPHILIIQTFETRVPSAFPCLFYLVLLCLFLSFLKQVRQSLLCPRLQPPHDHNPDVPVVGVDFDKAACLNRTCECCKGLSLLEMCDEERAVQRPVSFMLRKSVIYKTNKGVEKTRCDFVPKVLPIKAFLAHFENRLAELAPHHADMSWQSKDWKHVQKEFPRGAWICVQDFSENLTIEVKLEHQSKYYSSINITLFGMVASFWIDDVKDSYLSKEEKNRLKAELTKEGKPHQLHVTFAFISNDNRHNQAFVQHVNALALDHVCKYIMKKPPTATYGKSDGAPTQFQNATQHFWIGLHRHVTKTTRMDWCLHCTCHGKGQHPWTLAREQKHALKLSSL